MQEKDCFVLMQIFNKPQPTLLSEYAKAVVSELRCGDRTLGELRDSLALTYPELDKELYELRKTGIVDYYFTLESSTTPYMQWKLVGR